HDPPALHSFPTRRSSDLFRAVFVFDQNDTEGKPIAELESAQGDPSGYAERLKQFIAQRGIQLEYSDTIYPAQGQCSAGKIVLLRDRKSTRLNSSHDQISY